MRRYFLAALAALLGIALVIPARPAAAFESEHFELQRRLAELEGSIEATQQKLKQAENAAYAQPTVEEPAAVEPVPPAPSDDAANSVFGETNTPQMTSRPVYRTRTFSYPTDSGLIGSLEFGFIAPVATNGDQPSMNAAGTVIGAAGTGPNGELGPGVPLAAPLLGVVNGAAQTNIGYQVAPRFMLGYVIPGGMGLRGRYFVYDHTNTLTDPLTVTLSGRLRMQVADIETFGTLRWRRTSGTVFGGFRYADFNTVSTIAAPAASIAAGGVPFSFTAGQGAAGAGITGGVTGTSVIGQSGNFSLSSGLRGSALMGDIFASLVQDLGPLPPATINANYNSPNSFFSILEASLGSTYRRRLSNGTQLVIGSNIEFQFWQGGGTLNPWTYLSNNTPTAGVVSTPGSFGMLGFWNSFGFSY